MFLHMVCTQLRDVETDTLMLLYVEDAVNQVYNVSHCTIETNVVLFFFFRIQDNRTDECLGACVYEGGINYHSNFINS